MDVSATSEALEAFGTVYAKGLESGLLGIVYL